MLPVSEPFNFFGARTSRSRSTLKEKELRRQLVRAHATDVTAAVLQDVEGRSGTRGDELGRTGGTGDRRDG